MSELERWNERYSTPDYHFGTAPNAFLKSQQHLLKPGMKALSVADGEGRNGVWLAEQGLDVHTFDFSPNAHRQGARAGGGAWRHNADRSGRHPQLELAGGRLRRRRRDLHPVLAGAGPRKGLCRPEEGAQARRAAAAAGLPPKQIEYGTGGPKEVEQLYTRALLEQEFGDFASLDIREYDCLLHEGERHVGMSAVIDLVGRK